MLLFLILISSLSYAKDRTATLSNGTQVLLRDNGTWEEIKDSVGGYPIKCEYYGG